MTMPIRNRGRVSTVGPRRRGWSLGRSSCSVVTYGRVLSRVHIYLSSRMRRQHSNPGWSFRTKLRVVSEQLGK